MEAFFLVVATSNGTCIALYNKSTNVSLKAFYGQLRGEQAFPFFHLLMQLPAFASPFSILI